MLQYTKTRIHNINDPSQKKSFNMISRKQCLDVETLFPKDNTITNKKSIFDPMNDMNIKQNNITTNKHQKIMKDISHIYQQNKCFKKTINSLQEQNKALLLQKNWYKNKLKQLESVINQVFTNANDYKNIQFIPPFAEITKTNIQSQECIDLISKNNVIYTNNITDSSTKNGDNITKININNSEALYTTNISCNNYDSNTESNTNEWFCFDMSSTNVESVNTNKYNMKAKQHIKFENILQNESESLNLINNRINNDDLNEYTDNVSDDESVTDYESDNDIEILSQINDTSDDDDVEILNIIQNKDEREYDCNYRGCDSSYLTYSRLMQHIRLTHKKTYKCHLCKETFKEKINLKSHSKEEHGMW
eukprot:421731_1